MNLRIFIFFIVMTMQLYAKADILFKGISETEVSQLKKQFSDLANTKPSLSTIDDIIRLLTKIGAYSSITLESDDKGTYTLVATPQRKISELIISGNKKIDRDDIINALGIKIGTKISSGRLKESTERLKEFYGRKGYLNAVISFDIEDSPDNSLRMHVIVIENEPTLIKEIQLELEEDNRELSNMLNKRVRKYINRYFTENTVTSIESVINEYLRDNRYLSAKLQQKEAIYDANKIRTTLIYQISNPFSYEIIISGNKRHSSSYLLKRINLDEIFLGSTNLAQNISEMIKNEYAKTGFSHVNITYREKTVKNTFSKQIVINLNEGPQALIDSIDISGHISRPAKYYSKFILANSSDAVADKYFVRTDLENGYKNLIISLNNEGYLKAKIQPARIEYNSKKDRVKIALALDEGPLTQLSKINFYGIKSFTQAQLLKEMSIHNNMPLRLNMLENSISNIKKFYYNHGFIEMKIVNENESLVEYQNNGLQAVVNFKVYEGPQVFIKSIYINGNTFTKDYVILQETEINIGDLLTPNLINEAQTRLDKLALFSHIDISTLEANSSVSQRTLMINVVERNPGLFKFGAGFTNERGLTARGFTSISYSNLGGTARAISLHGILQNSLVQKNRLEYATGIGYLEPFMFNSRIRGRANYLRSEQIITNGSEKLEAKDSVNFVLEKDLTAKIKFSWLTWGFDSVKQFNMPDSGSLSLDSHLQIAYMGPSLDVDYRDNPFLPTKGFYAKLDAEYSHPDFGSSDKVNFVRTQAIYSYYMRTWSPKIVWANSFRAGYEKNLSALPGSGVPISFAFFLGGNTTVRGYSGTRGDRFPNSREFPNDTASQLIIHGESSVYLVKSELRFPIFKDPWGGVIFYDGGRVNIQGYDFKEPFRQSAGIGLRLNTPMGPISVDYAKKLNQQRSEDLYEWHISIGTF
ncbi:MAG: hypothetical protein A2Z20_07785 [Bdellovibrionales bacterium RBG_16_40_8]|nr:MAG: hypothetical protein A2Z20_07785 [Bdellovibrionales bacterium RBG_16_40_8]